ncbi:Hypothetical protein IALB_1451 [Ignavibacterium album JCM 16511]|uniref:SPOR domain-containing protein n=1 Tax=Ignavibacterium album (strain DSM 19864 / JCM 16511 / NBRC 101810 / Mat9-16) TaxID=945713 RepID=I0AJK4_IGNAJ|nr:SPOR domain-containing protein [Ignavibacterium album]AFH49161.1 Hypothetical protein IALB_1451 [Ignavibacterium album JCM 16511]
MKKSELIYIILSSVLFFILNFCSAKPTIRYDEKNKKSESTNEKDIKKETIISDENFDITPYRTEINLTDKKVDLGKSSGEIWYQYDVKDDASVKTKKIKGTMNGFRVQVIATDDLNEANKIQEELKVIKGNNEIYSVFEPPFYKILLGDFKTSDEANSLRFKLNQLGYADSKVVKSTINLFE